MEQNKSLRLSSTEAVLTRVLRRFGIPDTEYSIGIPAEQRVCIEKEDGEYHVYVMERGVKFDESYHKTEYDAHLELLHQLASSNAEYYAMSREYRKLLRDPRILPAMATNVSLGNAYTARNTSDVFVGDTVRVHIRFREGLREQVQVFEGTVIARKNSGVGKDFTVRRFTNGIGIEKTFPLDSPAIASIEVVRKSKMHSNKPQSSVLAGKVYKKKMKM